jgi:integrase
MGVKPRLRKNGFWYLVIDHKGQRKSISTRLRGRAGRKAAHRAAAELERRLSLDDLETLEARIGSDVTLARYADTWLARREDLKIGSSDLYHRVLRKHWLPSLGSRRLTAIRRQEILTVLDAMRQGGTKSKTRALRLNVLRSCLNSAVEDGLLTANPAARAGRFLLPTHGERRREVELSVFTAEELRWIMQVARVEFPREIYLLVLTLARTGLRPGEGRCLQIADVEFPARQLWVRRTEGRRARKHGAARFNAPKSYQVRRVDMSDQLVAEMQAYLEARQGERLASPWLFPPPSESLVSAHKKRAPSGGDLLVQAHRRRSGWYRPDEPIGHTTFSEFWRRLLSRAKVRYRKPHGLSHTYATRLIAEAVDHGQDGEAILHYVSKQLGHSSIEITVDYYGHLVPTRRRAIVNRLDDEALVQSAANPQQ